MEENRTGANPQAGLQVVCREQNGHASAYLATDDALEQGGAVRVQTGERFIKNEEVRTMQHSPRDRKSLQHAARKRSYRSVSDVCQFNLREQSRGVRLVDAVEAGEEAQVLLTVQISVEKTVVTDNTDAASEVPVRRKRASKHADAACLRANEPGHGPEERGLARAVRPEQHDRLATAHVEIDAA